MKKYILFIFSLLLCAFAVAQNGNIYGFITADSGDRVPYATIGIEGSTVATIANDKGEYILHLDDGIHVIAVTAVGYKPFKKEVAVGGTSDKRVNITLQSDIAELEEVVVKADAQSVSRVKRSAYNVVALSTDEMLNTTKNLSDVLAKTPGLKLREAGGVGSDMQITLDGFTGKHIKIFIDGVPQEGVGKSFGLNNIPVNYARSIEVYKGVVPVELGTDAMGGVINIVTGKRKAGWNVDASYSFGSYNTHKSFVNFNQTLANGFSYEINAFQNYSDNNYSIYAPVEDFVTGAIEKKKLQKVRRFNDTYHNEAVTLKAGVVGKSWADRLMFGVTLSNMHKDIQTGVRQEIVYGEKFRKGYSVMPSLEYRKRNLFVNGLDISATANYNRNATTNVDTAACKYNWVQETQKLNSPGEQSYQHSRADNNNWNATFTANYRLGGNHAHMFTLHHLFNAFERSNTSFLTKVPATDPIKKTTFKNVTGLAYRLMPSEKWNATIFGKFYSLQVGGPMATTSNQDSFVKESRSMNSFGYGIAGTYFIVKGLQAKLSYEKAYRLPTIEEMFGDEDLEQGNIGIKPENSHNINLNVSYDNRFGKHAVYAEGGLVYRDTHDYIQRNIIDISGGKSAATYMNYGKVLTAGFNLTARYTFGQLLTVGGNFTKMEVLDNMKTAMNSSVPNLSYRQRMPNLPCVFADADATLYWRDFLGKGNLLSLTYEMQFVERFCYYSQVIGSNKGDFMVPDQLSHNLVITCSVANGRYNFSVECRNFTNERLYDNFSLQKAGIGVYGKVRVCFGNK
ncbi:MAG: TonB-dependent receptor [Bacteroidaceae bacterium]|nr:TonB-dependent receptor [Bacteroidaceae bacterium]